MPLCSTLALLRQVCTTCVHQELFWKEWEPMPGKDKKGWEVVLKQKDKAFNDLFNKAAASLRQPVADSLFNRLKLHCLIQKIM